MRMEIDESTSKNAQLAPGYLNILNVNLEKAHYFFYDLETSGLHPQFDQIFQFSAVLISQEDFESLDFDKLVDFINRDTFSKPSDSNVFLKQVAIPNETVGGSATLHYINCYVKLNDDVIPSPQALLINRVNTHPIQENDLLNEFELSWLLHDFFRRNSDSLTFVGHNLLKYDHCMLTALFYRNLHNPDILVKMSVFDTYPIAVIYSLIEKNAFNKWPTKTVIKESSEPEQQPVFKLEKFKKKLGIALKSHQGFNDTLVTLALAVKLYSCKIERIWNFIPMICSFERTSEKLKRMLLQEQLRD